MCNQRMCTGLRTTTASRRVLARACSGTTAMLLENLENRQLLSFADDNLVTGPSVNDPPFVRPVEIAVGTGDKIVSTGGNLIARFNADGTRDTSFGSDGVVTTPLSRIHDVAVQGDGKVVVAGELNGQFAVARYTSAGQLDTTFSGDGITSRGFGGTTGADVARALVIQPDGKIVAVGAGRTARSGAATALVIARYNANGSVDTTFDNDGYSAELLRAGNDVANDVEIDGNRKIVVGGTTGTTGVVIRYNASGSFDTGFSGDGIAYLDEEHGDAPGSVSAIAVQGDGKVVWAGGTVIPRGDRFVPDAIVGRLNANGTEDDGFAQGGSTYLGGVFRDDETTASFAHDVAIDAHGNVVVVGQEERDDGAVSLAVVTVLEPGGVVHPAYDDEDNFDYVGFDSRSAAEGVALQSDGDIIVAGERESTTMMLARVPSPGEGGNAGGDDGDGPLDERFGGGDGVVEAMNGAGVGASPGKAATGPNGEIVAIGGNRITRHRSDGSRDTNFGGGDGEIVTDFTQIEDVAVQGDGRIVVVGHKDNIFRVARYTTAGQLDTTFSGDGVDMRSFGGAGGFDAALAVDIQDDGRIVVAGGGTTGSAPSNQGTVVVRYNANGSLDTTFDGDGVFVRQLRGDIHDWANDVAIADDGRIVVGAAIIQDAAILRLNTDGSLDTTFSGDGIASVPFGVRALNVQPDGRIVFGGSQSESMADNGDRIGRLTASGALDPSFGANGVVSDLFEREDYYSAGVNDVLVLPGGDIMVAGWNEDRMLSEHDAVLARLNPDGSVDHEFSGAFDDYVFIPFGNFSNANSLSLHGDDGLIVGGDRPDRVLLARYLIGVTGGPGGGGTGLTGTYYSNIDFTGNSITRTDAAVNFNWGSGGPSSTIGTDTFSVRWTGQVEAQKTEQYTFYTRTDDGVRLWVNGQLLVNMWVPQSATEWSGTINLVAGQKYDIKMEYFERYGGAVAELRWSSASTPKQVVPTSQLFPSGTGTPTDTQKPTMPRNLTATATHDRVVLDWDASTDNVGVVSYEILRNEARIATVNASQTSYTDVNVQPETGYGYKVVAIDAAGNRSDPASILTMTQPAPPQVDHGLRGVYYSNMDFTGSSITRTDANINFNWGTGGPSSTIGTDTFSVRWTGQIQAQKTERYTFYTLTDDGVRLWVNGQLIIDKWGLQSAMEWSGSIDLVAGQKYDIKMEYFERYGGAVAELRWSSASTPKQIVPSDVLFPGSGT